MKLSALLFAATMALAAPSPTWKREEADASPIKVHLEMAGNSQVEATIRNTGDSNLKLLKTGTILDTAAVEKSHVSQGKNEVAFDGAHLTIAWDSLTDDAFKTIKAGETIKTTFDVAEVHDLSKGGEFDIWSQGHFSYAEEGSNELVGSVQYLSNKIHTKIDGEKASLSHLNYNTKRTDVQDCTGTNLTIIRSSVRNCLSLAQAAASEAAFGPDDRMIEFFKDASSDTRSVVQTTFNRVRSECGSTTSGASDLYCSDRFNSCSPGVLAYTIAQASYMVYCPLFLDRLPLTTDRCYGQSKGNTVLHEVTHLREIKGTSDYGGYGYNFVQGLTAEQNLNHADTYTLFAQSIYAGC